MNNDVYNNKSSSLSEALARLNRAIQIRDAKAKGLQYDTINGVALDTTPLSLNNKYSNNQQSINQLQEQNNVDTYTPNIAERVVGTIDEAVWNIASSFLKLGEGVIDAVIAPTVGVFDKDLAEETIKYDITNTITTWSQDNLSINALYKNYTGENLFDQSYLNETNDKVRNIIVGVEQGIGSALGFMALGSIPYAGYPLIGMGAGGQQLEEALNSEYYNDNYWGAVGYGVLSGASEVGIEMLSAGFGKVLEKFGVKNGISAIAGKLSKNSTASNALVDIVGSFVSEGSEEVVSDLIDPLLSGLYNNRTIAENYSDLNIEELGSTFLVGGISGAIMQGGGEIYQTMYLSPEGKKISKEIEANRDRYSSAYEKFKKTSQVDIASQQKALNEFNKVKEEVANNMKEIGERISKLPQKYQNRLGTEAIIDGKRTRLPLTQDVMNEQSELIKNANAVEMAVSETMDLYNKQRVNSGLSNIEVEFTSNPNYNGMLDMNNNKLYLSTNPELATRQILSHEITHTLESSKEYKGISQDIIESLKENNKYEELKKSVEEKYKKSNIKYDEITINNEIIADYIANNFFKSYAEMNKAFTSQSKLNKFKELIKSLRSKSKTEKAKNKYLKLIQKLNETNVEKVEKYSLKKKQDFYIAFEKNNKPYYKKVQGEIFNEDNRLFYVYDKDLSKGKYQLIDIQTGLLVVKGNTKKQMLEAYEKVKEKLNNLYANKEKNSVLKKKAKQLQDYISKQQEQVVEDTQEEVENKIEKEVEKTYNIVTLNLALSKERIEETKNDEAKDFKDIKAEDISFNDKIKNKVDSIKTIIDEVNKRSKWTYKTKLKHLSTELIEYLEVEGKPLNEFLGLDVESNDYKYIQKTLKNNLYTNMLSSVNNFFGITSLNEQVNILKANVRFLYTSLNNVKRKALRARKATIKVSKLLNDFKQMKDKNYKNGTIEAQFKGVANNIYTLKIDRTTNLNKSARNVINEEIGPFLMREGVANNVLKEMPEQYEYVSAILDYFSKTNIGTPINTYTPITTNELLEGNTEIELVKDILSITKKVIRLANNKVALINGEEIDVKESVNKEYDYQQSIKRKNATKLLNLPNQYFLSLIDVKAYIGVMAHSDSNSLMYKLYEELRNGQHKTYKTLLELQKPLDNFIKDKENKKLIKKLNKKIKFFDIEMTYGEAISLYMMTKTDNASSHLIHDGVAFRSNQEGINKRILGSQIIDKYIKSNKNIKDLYNYIEGLKYRNQDEKEELASIYSTAIDNFRNDLKDTIGNDFDNLIETIEKIYTISGDIYSQASEDLLGHSYDLKDYYYPTKSASIMFKDGTDSINNYLRSQLNPSFAKKVLPKGTSTLMVDDVLETVLAFNSKLSKFAGVTISISNVQKVLNARVIDSKTNIKSTLPEYFNNNVDKHFTSRMDNLFREMQGLNPKDNSIFSKAFRWLRKQGVRMTLGAKLKSMLVQTTSYPRASMYLDRSSLIKGLFKYDGLYDFNKIMELSPQIANRYYDNNILKAESVGAFDKVDSFTDFFMKGYEVMDRLPIKGIWKACQIQIIKQDGFINDTNIDKAVKLFDQVIEDTQAQYDALGNGDITRVKNEFVKGFLMYQSESRKLFSRLYEGVYSYATAKKGTMEYEKAKRLLSRSITNVLFNAVAATMINAIFKSLRGDYDDDEAEETMKDILVGDFSSQIIGMFPFISNLYNKIVNDYDIEVSGYTQVSELMSIFTKEMPILTDLNSSNDEIRTALISVVTKIGHFFGIPVKNLFDDILIAGRGVDLISGAMGYDTGIAIEMRNFWYNTSNQALSTLLKSYKAKGNESQVKSVLRLKMKNYGAGNIDESSLNELTRLYMNNSINQLPKMIGEEISYNGEIVKLTKEQTEKAKETYSLANELFKKMITLTSYKNLSDEEKAKAILRLYNTYYDLAKSTIFKDIELNKVSKVSQYIDMSKYAIYLSAISNMSETKELSRTKQVQTYINRTGLTKTEKYLLSYLSGYKLNDESKKLVQSYLIGKGMNNTEVKNYLDM